MTGPLPRRLASAALILFAFLFSESSAQVVVQPSIQPVVLSGEQAPDGVGVFSSWALGPVISNDSKITFLSTVAQTSSASLTGFFSGDLMTGFEMRTFVGQEFVDPTLGTFRVPGLTNTRVNERGDLLIQRTRSGFQYPVTDILTLHGDQFNYVAALSATVTGPNGSFLGMLEPRINNSGEVAFIGSFAGTNGQFRGTGLWSNADGDLRLLIGDNDLSNTAINRFGPFSGLSFNDNGDAAFYATAELSPSVIEDRIWSLKNGQLTIVADEGTGATGTTGRFFNISDADPAFNQAGDVAFASSLSGVPSFRDSGIWQRGRTSLQIAEENDPAPGLVNTRFGELSFSGDHLHLNGNGTALFSAAIDGPGGGFGAGVWKNTAGGLELIVSSLAVAPGTNKLFLNSFFQELAINNKDDVAFHARLVDPANTNVSTGDGIWIEGDNGLTLVVATGSELVVGPGDERIVESVRFASGTRNEEGLGVSAFNDLGQLVFAATFTDGSQGVFLYGVLIPEPSTVSLFVISMACVLSFRIFDQHARQYARRGAC